MLPLLLLLSLVWQLFAGTLVIAPVSRRQDPAAYWLTILIETCALAFLVLYRR